MQASQSVYDFSWRSLLRPGSIGIDAALDFGDALGVAVNHAGDGDRAADEDGADRNQQRAKPKMDSISLFIRRFPQACPSLLTLSGFMPRSIIFTRSS